MDHHMTGCTVLESRQAQVMKSRRARPQGFLLAGQPRRVGVAFQTERLHAVARKHARVIRAVWGMARHAAFQFDGRVLEYKWTALVTMTFQACEITAYTGAQLFILKAAMLVMTVRTFHGAFWHLVMERLGK